jgi:small subunit ribosomal protein S17
MTPTGQKPATRSPRKTVIGRVVSNKMQKTITVEEARLVKHEKYGKYIRRAVQYKAHDEKGAAKHGDLVEIVHVRPLSKTKHWSLVQVLEKGRVQAVLGEEDREKAAPPPKKKPEPPAPKAAASAEGPAGPASTSPGSPGTGGSAS